MESWQIKCIQANLSNLIKFTDCNVIFLAELGSHLSEFDKAELRSTKLNDVEKTGYFYKIAQQRSGMFEDLLMALVETKQSGAFSILMKEYIAQSDGGVSNCFISSQVQISQSWWNDLFGKQQKCCSEKIETFKFSNSILFTFLDLLLSKHNTLITDTSIQNMTKEFLSKWVHACVMGSYINLLKITLKRGVILRIFESKYLLLLAVSFSDTSIVDLILTHYIQQTKVNLPNTKFVFLICKYDSVNYSILDIAALRGSLPVIQILLRATAEDAANLLHSMCLSIVGTRLLQDVQIFERKRIIEFILQKFPKLIQNWPTNVNTPLLYPNVHVDLITNLIDLGIDVLATDRHSRRNILHLCPKYMSPEEYDKLIRHLHARGDSKMFHTKDPATKETPLHVAMKHLEVLDSTLELFLSAKVDFNSVNVVSATPLLYAVGHNRSERLLKSLVRAGADINKRSFFNESALHIAAQVGNLTALKYFISCGCEVNAMTNSGYTPLDFALLRSNKQSHEIVQELVRNGARVNAKGDDFHYLLQMIKDGKV